MMPKIKSLKRKADSSNSLSQCKIETPIGCMTAVADNEFVYLLEFDDGKKLLKKIDSIKKELSCGMAVGETKILSLLKKELQEYFEGTLKEFSTPVKFVGTDFQKESWQQLSKLSYGNTMTYVDLAKQLGRDSKHARAVGSTAGANPLLIIVPCHRLVASGNQGGYSSGEDRKSWLLKHEDSFKKSK